jgi:serine/threonine protein kinase
MAFTGRRFIDECFQARGKQVDQRADIWAFRVVLYEMLTGQRLFQGDDATETLALVIKDEPKWERVPAKVQRLVRSCLKKDPKRLQAIGDWGGRTIRRCTPCFFASALIVSPAAYPNRISSNSSTLLLLFIPESSHPGLCRWAKLDDQSGPD